MWKRFLGELKSCNVKLERFEEEPKNLFTWKSVHVADLNSVNLREDLLRQCGLEEDFVRARESG